MQAARRLYLYAMSGITLLVIAIGLAILLELLIEESGLLQRPNQYFGFDGPDPRERLSQAVAMLGVGVPVWAVHWWLIRRGLAPGRPDRAAEHGSAIRAGYLTLVLTVSLIAWVSAASVLVVSLVATAIGESSFLYSDTISAASTAAAGFLVWLYHGVVRRGDLDDEPVHGAAAWLPRVYLYGIALGALIAAITGLQAVANNLLSVPEFDPDYARFAAIQGGVSTGAWGLVWAAHWWYATRLAGTDGWRGVEEGASRTRLAAFIATIVVAIGFTIAALSELAQAIIGPATGDVPYAADQVVQAAIRPLAGAVPWAIAWWAHVRWLRREPAAADPLRALHQARLATHAPAAVALAFGATAIGWVAGIVVDLVLGGSRTTESAGLFGSSWTYELARWLPMAVIAMSIWAWHWSGVVARRRLDPDGEANSAIRRAFLYLTLGVGVVAGLASAAVILYRLVGTVLGGLGGDAVTELSTPVGALIAAAVVLAYHGSLLRADQRRRPVEGAGGMPVEAAGAMTVAASEAETGRWLELRGPAGADLDAALAAARAALPDGFELLAPEA